MTKQLSISIVTCSYQQGRFLESTIRSVIDQKNVNVEYIIIDGGSTDNSVSILEKHSDHLTYWTSEKDSGQTDALIKGFNIAKGDILGWLCSDDLLLPNALSAVTRFFAAHPEIDAVYGDAVWIDALGIPIRPKKEMPFNRFVLSFDHNYIPQPSMFWRRSLYDAVGGLDRGFNLAMDNDLWHKFSQRTNIAHVSDFWSAMRW